MDTTHLRITLTCPYCRCHSRMDISVDADWVTRFDWVCWACHGWYVIRLGDYVTWSYEEKAA